MILVPENKKGDKFESFHPRRTWEKPQNSSFSWEIGFRISIFGYRAIVLYNVQCTKSSLCSGAFQDWLVFLLQKFERVSVSVSVSVDLV